MKEEKMGTALPQGARWRLTAKSGASQLFGMARDGSRLVAWAWGLLFSSWGKAMRPVPLVLGAWLGGWVARPDGPDRAARSYHGGMVAMGRGTWGRGCGAVWSTNDVKNDEETW
jgi:hypothetical protein